MIRKRLSSLLAVLLLLPTAGGNEESPSPYAKQAQSLLDKGKNLKALNMAKLGLEYESDDPRLLDLASRAAMELDPDVAIWYADEAMVVIGESPEDSELEVLRETLEERIRKLDPFLFPGLADNE